MAPYVGHALLMTLLVTSLRGEMTVYDMTYVLSEDTAIGFPIVDPFILTRGQRGPFLGVEWLAINSFSTSEHRGTHTDAPFHFNREGWTNEQVPASRLVGPGVIIDVTSQVETNPKYQLSVDDIRTHERVYGRIPNGAVVVMNSGWGSRYPDPNRVFSTENLDDRTTYMFPSLHPEAVRFLAQQRSVVAIGVDTPSVDAGGTVNFESHVIMSENEILALESLANVGTVPPRGSIIVIGLPKLREGTGGPSRVLAIVDDRCRRDTGGNRRKSLASSRRTPYYYRH